MSKKTVSLVLGSGGARGLAHIGVIHRLEENNYEIRSISGASIGALVGGIYACGELDVFEKWVRAITKMQIVKLLDVSWGKQGLVEGDRVIDTLKELVGDRRIEDLPIKYTAIATNVRREKEIWLKSGSVFDAIRASISLPLFLTPFEMNGMKLLDGGILNPVPIAPTFEDHNDITLAVNLGGTPTGTVTSTAKRGAKDDDNSAVGRLQEKINSFIDDLMKRSSSGDSDGWTMLDIADQTFDAMQGTIARQKLATYPPDHTIEIARDVCGTLEFDRANEMIALGYDAAARSLGHS